MKRWIALFIILMALPALVACAEDPAARAYYPPTVTPAPSPEGMQGNLQYIEAANAADYATATAAAWATMIAPPATATPDPFDGVRAIHLVVSGESLSSIAIKWNCPQEALQRANQDLIQNPDSIQVGWEIKIPADCS